MKKYVLTGGPGSGKSSIILALEQRGEYVIREAAEDYIKYRQAQGSPSPWKEKDFQQRILKLQIQRESMITPDAGRVFIDRGFHDGLAYEKRNHDTRTSIRQAMYNTKYDGIFLVELLGDVHKTKVRRENKEHAKAIENDLYKIYCEDGYRTVRIAANPLEKRVKQILKIIGGGS